ncbi:hypothetical protein [Actinomadura meyerae]|nr:hypothetical protein [Actinomadura meyerae]
MHLDPPRGIEFDAYAAAGHHLKELRKAIGKAQAETVREAYAGTRQRMV